MSTEPNDPLIGTKITTGGREVTLVERKGDHYRVEGEAGFKGWLRADAVAKRMPAASPASIVQATIEAYLRGDIQVRAAVAYQDLERMRAGLEPTPLTDADRQMIAARLAAGPRVPIDAETRARVQANLDRKPTKAQTHDEAVRTNVLRMIARGGSGL